MKRITLVAVMTLGVLAFASTALARPLPKLGDRSHGRFDGCTFTISMPALEIMNGEAVGIIDTATVRCIHAVRFTTLQVGMPTRGERQDPYPTEKPSNPPFSPWRARAGKTYVIHKDVGCATDAQGNQLDHRFLGTIQAVVGGFRATETIITGGKTANFASRYSPLLGCPAQQFVDPS